MAKQANVVYNKRAVKVGRKFVMIKEPMESMEMNEKVNLNNMSKKHYATHDPNNEVQRLLFHNSLMISHNVNHSDIPAFNIGMRPMQMNALLSNYPSCAFSNPRPIFIGSNQCQKIDLCYRRPMNIAFYKQRMRHTRTSYQKALKRNKNIRNGLKNNIYHPAIFDLASRKYYQPDVYFDSSYDFYFTGGNLCSLQNDSIVVHGGGEKLKYMSVSAFPSENSCDNNSYLNQLHSIQTAEDCEIFEVQPLIRSSCSTERNSFIARQRNLITFNTLNDDKKIITLTQFRTKSTPFISFAQSERNINNFIITTMKQHIRLYDLNSASPALVKLFEISPKEPNISWNTVKPWRENTFMYANQNQFFMADVRTSPDQWLNESTFTNDRQLCDHISAILPSNFSNLFYVATNHKLMCLDVRRLQKYSLSNCKDVVSCWTHQLCYPPLMIDTFRLPQTEFIALSSPIASDLHICQLSRERNLNSVEVESATFIPKHIYSSVILPYQPPTLLEAYEAARVSGKCLRPESNFEARLKYCTTGLKFLNFPANNTNCGIGLLLFLNSNGDIFAHTISKREQGESEERCSTKSIEVLAEFERKISKQVHQPLNYTFIKDMRGLRKVFLCEALSLSNKEEFDMLEDEYKEIDVSANAQVLGKKKRPKHLQMGHWQKSFKTLKSYKDALAADLLSIWDIDVDDESKTNFGDLSHIEKTHPEVKVQDWLAQYINIDPPMTAIPSHMVSRYCENDTSQVFDNTTSQTNNTIDFENVVHSTQIHDNSANTLNIFDTSGVVIQINEGTKTAVVEKLKNRKKTKKYVKGF